MGTSVDQIDRTYGHLMLDAVERTRARLDDFVRLFPERSQRPMPTRPGTAWLTVGAARFEPATLVPQTNALTRLRHAPQARRTVAHPGTARPSACVSEACADSSFSSAP